MPTAKRSWPGPTALLISRSLFGRWRSCYLALLVHVAHFGAQGREIPVSHGDRGHILSRSALPSGPFGVLFMREDIERVDKISAVEHRKVGLPRKQPRRHRRHRRRRLFSSASGSCCRRKGGGGGGGRVLRWTPWEQLRRLRPCLLGVTPHRTLPSSTIIPSSRQFSPSPSPSLPRSSLLGTFMHFPSRRFQC